MNPLAMKRKMFEEMKDVSKADGADALRAKYAPPEAPPEEMGAEPGAGQPDLESESQPVPGMEGEEGGADSEASLDALFASLSEEQKRALLSGE